MTEIEKRQERHCRLCTGATTPLFKLKVLDKHAVDYLRCDVCGSLQTEPPYWIEEAYDRSNLTMLDTGAAQRNLNNLAICYYLSKIIKAENLIDLGGGDGLLCRFLRDYKLNCSVKDKYAQATYAQGYLEPDFLKPHLVMGFELLEHMVFPANDVDYIFRRDADFVLLSTVLYTGQDKDWWYLVPETGQHVYFYSLTAIRTIAGQYGYDFIKKGSYIFFFRELSGLQKLLAREVLRRRNLRFLKALLMFTKTHGVQQDFSVQKQKL